MQNPRKRTSSQRDDGGYESDAEDNRAAHSLDRVGPGRSVRRLEQPQDSPGVGMANPHTAATATGPLSVADAMAQRAAAVAAAKAPNALLAAHPEPDRAASSSSSSANSAAALGSGAPDLMRQLYRPPMLAPALASGEVPGLFHTGQDDGAPAYSRDRHELSDGDSDDDDANVLYRTLTAEQRAAIDEGKGIEAKSNDPADRKTAAQHVASGSSKGFASQFVSATRSKRAAYSWAIQSKQKSVAKVQLRPEDMRADLSNDDRRSRLGLGATADNFAKSSNEVLTGDIPNDRVAGVHDLTPETVAEYNAGKADPQPGVEHRRHRKAQRRQDRPVAMRVDFTPNPNAAQSAPQQASAAATSTPATTSTSAAAAASSSSHVSASSSSSNQSGNQGS